MLLQLLTACDATDTADPTEVRLADGCTPGTPAVDPLVERSALSVTSAEPGQPFMELVEVDLVDDVAWAVGQGGLLVAGLDDAGTLTERHRDPGMGRHHRVELAGDAVALAHHDAGLELRAQADPGTTGATRTGPGAEGMAAVGDRLYVADRTRGLVVYRVGTADALEEIGVVAGAAATWELAAAGGVLYGADNSLGLVAWDLADADAPVYLGALGAPGGALDVDFEAGVVYVARGAAGVDVYDADDPTAPTLATTLDVGGSAVSVAASAGWLWAADHESVQVWRTEDPPAPTPFAHQRTRQFALAVDADGPNAVVGDWGYLEAWSVDSGGVGPALDLDVDALRAAAGEATLTLTNRGAGPLELRGAEASGAEVWATSAALDPGEWGTVSVRWSGAAPSELCLATNDPDLPTLTLPIGAAPTPPVGEPAPDFTLPVLDGGTVRLSEQLGHPVVLAYFATW